MIWSYSKLSSFDFCPYQYKLRYIDKRIAESNEYMIRGNRFHEFAENFFYTLKDSDDIQKHIDEWKTTCKDKESPEFKFIISEEKRFKKLKKNRLEQFFPPIHTELEIKRGTLVGTIDRIDTENDKITIIDYKPKKTSNITNLRKQLNIYYMLYLEYTKKEPSEAFISSYFYNENKWWTEPISRRSVNATMKWIEKTIEKIENTKTFNKKITQFTCKNCKYKSICRGQYVYP